MMILRLTCIATVFAMLHGCAWMTHYKSDLGDPKLGVSVDIKQRMVLKNTPVVKEGAPAPMPRICAEPSPDAISSLGAGLGGGFFTSSKEKAQISAAISESAGFVGLRTQSIQLMRDSMYRACEAYMSGAISDTEYLYIQRRFQAQVVGLLAVEQLTGTITAPPMIVRTGAAANQGGDINVAADRVTTAQQQLADAQRLEADAAKTYGEAKSKAAALQKEKDKFSDVKEEDYSTEQKQTVTDLAQAREAEGTAKEKHDEAKARTATYKETAEIAKDAYQATKNSSSAMAAGDGYMPTHASARRVSPQSIGTIASSVEHIVDKVLNGAFNDTFERCTLKLLDSPPETFDSIKGVCESIALRTAAIKVVDQDDKASNAQLQRCLLKLLDSPPDMFASIKSTCESLALQATESAYQQEVKASSPACADPSPSCKKSEAKPAGRPAAGSAKANARQSGQGEKGQAPAPATPAATKPTAESARLWEEAAKTLGRTPPPSAPAPK